LSVCFLIFCFIRGGMFVNIIKFKVSVYPQCHLIVPENGWRIVCSGLKKVAANTGSLGTENQYYPSYSSSIKQALVAYDKVKGIISLFVYRHVYSLHTHKTAAILLRVRCIYHIFEELATMLLCQIFIIG